MKPKEMCVRLNVMKDIVTKYAPRDAISETVAAFWCDALQDFSDEQIDDAFKYAYSNLTEWPAPAKIKSLCLNITKDDDEIGNEVAASIYEALNEFGHMRPNQAREKIGELGWRVVQACGGWYQISRIENEQEGAFAKKRWKELAMSFHKGYVQDGFNRAHQIPAKSVVPDFLLK